MELFLALSIREMGSPKSRYGLMAKGASTLFNLIFNLIFNLYLFIFIICSFCRISQNRRIEGLVLPGFQAPAFPRAS